MRLLWLVFLLLVQNPEAAVNVITWNELQIDIKSPSRGCRHFFNVIGNVQFDSLAKTREIRWPG